MWYLFCVVCVTGYCCCIITDEQCHRFDKDFGVRVYTTPGSYLHINVSNCQPYIDCEFISAYPNSESEIINKHKGNEKYQIINRKMTTINIQAQQKLGHYHKTLIRGNQTRTLNEKGKTLL